MATNKQDGVDDSGVSGQAEQHDQVQFENNKSRWSGYFVAIKRYWGLISFSFCFALVVWLAYIFYKQNQEVHTATQQIMKTCKIFHFDDISDSLTIFLKKSIKFTQIAKLSIDELNKTQNELWTQLTGIHEKLKNMERKYNSTKAEMQENLHNLEREHGITITHTREQLKILEGKHDSTKAELQENLKKLHSTTAGQQEEMKFIGKQMESTDYSIYIFVSFIIIAVTIVMNTFWTYSGSAKTNQRSVNNHTARGEREHLNILDKIEKCSLDKSITVVSFSHGSRQKRHTELSKRVADPKYTINSIYINTTEHILNIHSKVALVFVDSNDRHIILESGQEIGQPLKSLAVQGIWKMGGEAIVIYYDHKESKSLKDDELYSPELKSVTTHNILFKLQKSGCVFSVFTEFTNYQIHQLQRKLNEYLH